MRPQTARRPQAKVSAATQPSILIAAQPRAGITVSELIKLARPFDLDQAGVAKLLGVTSSTLSRWLANGGTPTTQAGRAQVASASWALARAYDVYPTKLLPKWLRTGRREFAGLAPYHLIHQGRADELLAYVEEQAQQAA